MALIKPACLKDGIVPTYLVERSMLKISEHPCRVIVVDDHAMIRRGLAALLRARPGFRLVGEAATGFEALNLANALRPDVAIVDYSLPEINGRDLTIDLIRRVPTIEVLIYTHQDNPNVISGALAAGAKAYVLKSESETHLLAALEALSTHRPYFSGLVADMVLDEVLGTKATWLTTGEREMLELVAKGQTCAEISEELGLSDKRTQNLRRDLKGKVGERTTAGLVRYALRNGLVEP